MSEKGIDIRQERVPAVAHPRIHLNDIRPRPAFLQAWERVRHRQLHWLMECMAEFVRLLFSFVFIPARVCAADMCADRSACSCTATLVRSPVGWHEGVLSYAYLLSEQVWAHRRRTLPAISGRSTVSDVSPFSLPLHRRIVITDTHPSPAVFGIGVSYAVGLGLGLTVATATSGAHFSPSITLVRVLFEGFPKWKGLRCVAFAMRT